MWVQATTALADFRSLTVFSAIPVVDCIGSDFFSLLYSIVSYISQQGQTWCDIDYDLGVIKNFLEIRTPESEAQNDHQIKESFRIHQ